jgi:hypothetical protein
LILHKVRGQPAFDVAESTEIAGEAAWVLCTCGHRAYPVATWPLFDVTVPDVERFYTHAESLPEWPAVPDHYEPGAKPPKPPKPPTPALGKFLRELSDDELSAALNAVMQHRKT